MRFCPDDIDKCFREESCLIILDGLDEWSHPINRLCAKSRKKIPHRRVSTNCTFLTVTRPWKLNQVALSSTDIDKCLEIKGIENRDDLMKKILHCFNATNTIFDCKLAFEKYDFHVRKLLDIPLLTIQLVCIWQKDRKLPNSLSQLYSTMVDIMLGIHSIESHENKKIKLEPNTLPYCFSDTKFCKKHVDFLEKLGKLAFETLFNENTVQRIVFSSDIAELYLDDEMKAFALRVGILTERKTPSLCFRKSEISFLHKTLQDFFAAFSQSRLKNEIETCKRLEQIHKHLTEGVDITHFFLFVNGMCSDFGSVLSRKLNNMSFVFEENHEWVISLYLQYTQKLMTKAFRESVENGLENTDIVLKCAYLQNGLPSAFEDADYITTLCQKLIENNKERIEVIFARIDDEHSGDSINLDLSQFSNLKLIDLEGLQYNVSIRPEKLMHCTLKEIDLSTGNISEGLEKSFFLQSLHVISCSFSRCQGDVLFIDLERCSDLRSFCFENKPRSNIEFKIVGKVLRQCKVRFADLSKVSITKVLKEAKFLQELELIDCTCTYCPLAEHSCIIDVRHCFDLNTVCIKKCQGVGVTTNSNSLVTCNIIGSDSNELVSVNITDTPKALEDLHLQYCTSLATTEVNCIDLKNCNNLSNFRISNVDGIAFDINAKKLNVCSLVNYDLTSGNIVSALIEARELIYLQIVSCKCRNDEYQIIDLTQCQRLPLIVIEHTDIVIRCIIAFKSEHYPKIEQNGRILPLFKIIQTEPAEQSFPLAEDVSLKIIPHHSFDLFYNLHRNLEDTESFELLKTLIRNYLRTGCFIISNKSCFNELE